MTTECAKDRLLLAVLRADRGDHFAKAIKAAVTYPFAKLGVLHPRHLVHHIGDIARRILLNFVRERDCAAKLILFGIIVIIRLNIGDKCRTKRRLRRGDELRRDQIAVKNWDSRARLDRRCRRLMQCYEAISIIPMPARFAVTINDHNIGVTFIKQRISKRKANGAAANDQDRY